MEAEQAEKHIRRLRRRTREREEEREEATGERVSRPYNEKEVDGNICHECSADYDEDKFQDA